MRSGPAPEPWPTRLVAGPMEGGIMRHFAVLALLALALAAPARAQSPCTFDREFWPMFWQLEPARPCPGQPVRLTVFTNRNCNHLLGLERIDSLGVRVRVDEPEVCVAQPAPESLSVELGPFA